MNYRIIVIAFTLVTAAAACGGEDGGPIDGTWLVTGLSCNDQAQPLAGEFTLIVDNETGTFEQKFTDSCVITLDETYRYPDDQTFSIIPDAISCDPNDGCAALFGGADCLPLPAAVDFAYELDGDQLTLSRTVTDPMDLCPVGEEMKFVQQRQ